MATNPWLGIGENLMQGVQVGQKIGGSAVDAARIGLLQEQAAMEREKQQEASEKHIWGRKAYEESQKPIAMQQFLGMFNVPENQKKAESFARATGKVMPDGTIKAGDAAAIDKYFRSDANHSYELTENSMHHWKNVRDTLLTQDQSNPDIKRQTAEADARYRSAMLANKEIANIVSKMTHVQKGVATTGDPFGGFTSTRLPYSEALSPGATALEVSPTGQVGSIYTAPETESSRRLAAVAERNATTAEKREKRADDDALKAQEQKEIRIAIEKTFDIFRDPMTGDLDTAAKGPYVNVLRKTEEILSENPKRGKAAIQDAMDHYQYKIETVVDPQTKVASAKITAPDTGGRIGGKEPTAGPAKRRGMGTAHKGPENVVQNLNIPKKLPPGVKYYGYSPSKNVKLYQDTDGTIYDEDGKVYTVKR